MLSRGKCKATTVGAVSAEKWAVLGTECPKSPLTTLNLINLKIKSCVVKANTYLKTRGLHSFSDTKLGVRITFTRDL